MATIDNIRNILKDVLQLGQRADGLQEATSLFGSIPEFDSVAVVSVLTAIEDRFGIFIEDDEISAETFETVGNLSNFVDQKLAAL
ncbi:MAG: acyl carrier protein [Rhodospirillaceae bacterium]|jgi:acyl carrier protein|nr:acyl carrier protein [Rhodospirillaceae bacterium]MBT5047948.1 acyl carrier protein [Rhodospirillaceae bacterium]MBT5458931.1 acyl carrier protein [Rhodospirillaceae bacterium]